MLGLTIFSNLSSILEIINLGKSFCSISKYEQDSEPKKDHWAASNG